MKKKIKIILVIIWMVIIFIMSSFNSQDSSTQSNFLVNIIVNIFNINNISLVSLIIRKLAHFTEYFILGILIINIFDKDNIKNILIAISLCIIYSISDEIHQIFVPGRVGSIIDVTIDTFGSISGIFLYHLFSHKRLNKLSHNCN